MIIQLDDGTANDVEAARCHLEALARSWGHEIIEVPANTSEAAATARHDDKVIDPVSLAALVVSLPSAALAVLDLADRIRKRRRAKELINHAQQLAAQHVTVSLLCPNHPVELATLTPDQLLDLVADDNLSN